MRFLITTNCQSPFITDIFDLRNHFNAGVGMVVYDLALRIYTADGEKWEPIDQDHL